MLELAARLKLIKLVVLDVDGVLTDGSIIYAGDQIEIKTFHVHDGFGITMAKHAGLKFGVLTGRVADAVKLRVEELGFDFYEYGHFYKQKALMAMIKSSGLKPDNVLYMGDDILDLVCKPCVGVFVAPANAVPRVKQHADWVLDVKGGDAAVRAMLDKLLSAQGKLKQSQDYFIGANE